MVSVNRTNPFFSFPGQHGLAKWSFGETAKVRSSAGAMTPVSPRYTLLVMYVDQTQHSRSECQPVVLVLLATRVHRRASQLATFIRAALGELEPVASSRSSRSSGLRTIVARTPLRSALEA